MKKGITLLFMLTACIFLLCGCTASLKDCLKDLQSGDTVKIKTAVQQITAIYKDKKNKDRYNALELLASKATDYPDARTALDGIMKDLQAEMDPSKPIHDGKNVDDNASTIAQINIIANHLPEVYEEKLLKMMQESKKGTKKEDLGRIAVFFNSKETGLSLMYFTFYPMPENHRLAVVDFENADTAVIYEERETVIGKYDDNITVATAEVYDLKFFDLATGTLIAEDSTGVSASAPSHAIAGSGIVFAGSPSDTDLMNCILRNTK